MNEWRALVSSPAPQWLKSLSRAKGHGSARRKWTLYADSTGTVLDWILGLDIEVNDTILDSKSFAKSTYTVHQDASMAGGGVGWRVFLHKEEFWPLLWYHSPALFLALWSYQITEGTLCLLKNKQTALPGSMATKQTSITASFYLLRALTWDLVPWHGGALLHPQPQHAFLPPPVLQECCLANTGKGVKEVVGRSQKN